MSGIQWQKPKRPSKSEKTNSLSSKSRDTHQTGKEQSETFRNQIAFTEKYEVKYVQVVFVINIHGTVNSLYPLNSTYGTTNVKYMFLEDL